MANAEPSVAIARPEVAGIRRPEARERSVRLFLAGRESWLPDAARCFTAGVRTLTGEAARCPRSPDAPPVAVRVALKPQSAAPRRGSDREATMVGAEHVYHVADATRPAGALWPGQARLYVALEPFQVEAGPVDGVEVGDEIEDCDGVPVVLVVGALRAERPVKSQELLGSLEAVGESEVPPHVGGVNRRGSNEALVESTTPVRLPRNQSVFSG